MSGDGGVDLPIVSMLFVPASDRAKLAKARGLAVGALILDLEDSVAVAEKGRARQAAAEEIASGGNPLPLWVRVNGSPSGLLEDDLDAVVRAGLAGIDLPKVESPEQLATVSEQIASLEARRGLERGSVQLIATIETAVGVGAVDAIAGAGDERLHCLGFGAGDLCLDIGIDNDPASPTIVAAKVQLVLASRRAQLHPPHDSAYVDFRDDDGLRRDTLRGKSIGFFGKHAIHPSQIDVIEEVYRPSADQVAHARRVVDAFQAAEAAGAAAISVEGSLVDYPLAERARRLLAAAEASGHGTQKGTRDGTDRP